MRKTLKQRRNRCERVRYGKAVLPPPLGQGPAGGFGRRRPADGGGDGRDHHQKGGVTHAREM